VGGATDKHDDRRMAAHSSYERNVGFLFKGRSHAPAKGPAAGYYRSPTDSHSYLKTLIDDGVSPLMAKVARDKAALFDKGVRVAAGRSMNHLRKSAKSVAGHVGKSIQASIQQGAGISKAPKTIEQNAIDGMATGTASKEQRQALSGAMSGRTPFHESSHFKAEMQQQTDEAALSAARTGETTATYLTQKAARRSPGSMIGLPNKYQRDQAFIEQMSPEQRKDFDDQTAHIHEERSRAASTKHEARARVSQSVAKGGERMKALAGQTKALDPSLASTAAGLVGRLSMLAANTFSASDFETAASVARAEKSTYEGAGDQLRASVSEAQQHYMQAKADKRRRGSMFAAAESVEGIVKASLPQPEPAAMTRETLGSAPAKRQLTASDQSSRAEARKAAGLGAATAEANAKRKQLASAHGALYRHEHRAKPAKEESSGHTPP
jgi:hypothetical protein